MWTKLTSIQHVDDSVTCVEPPFFLHTMVYSKKIVTQYSMGKTNNKIFPKPSVDFHDKAYFQRYEYHLNALM